jgi:hypothetical protein
MSGRIFIIDVHFSSFATASLLIFRQAIIVCTSDADMFILVIIAVQAGFFIMSSLDIPMHESIIFWSGADICIAGCAPCMVVHPALARTIIVAPKAIIGFMGTLLGRLLRGFERLLIYRSARVRFALHQIELRCSPGATPDVMLYSGMQVRIIRHACHAPARIHPRKAEHWKTPQCRPGVIVVDEDT